MMPSMLTFWIKAALPAALLMAAPAWAANVVERAGEKLRYDNCLALAGQNPAAAFGAASKWVSERGGAPAEHCAAVALVGLKRYAEAAGRLDALGRAPDVGDLRPTIFDQAGNAWLLAGKPEQAVASFQAALALSGNDPELYADLARAQAVTKDWRNVEADMNAALAIAPQRADLLVLRASARHALGKMEAARADLEAALAARPNYPEALVERGNIARERGDVLAARADFQNALEHGAGGETADSAGRALAALAQAPAINAKRAPKPLAKAPAKAKPATPPKH
jgi:tetratricopeptide (TPR) repeat protein